MSLPPQTSGEVLIAKIPADMKAPEYITVKSMTADADGNWKLVSTAGTEYAVAADCRIMPYLTRQIVSLEDVAQGDTCLSGAMPRTRHRSMYCSRDRRERI